MYLLGKQFHHDDTVSTKDLKAAFAKTTQLWKKVYGKNLESFGGLNLGNPPNSFYDPKWLNIGNEGTRENGFVPVTIESDPQAHRQRSSYEEDDGFACQTAFLFISALFVVIVTFAGVLVGLYKEGAFESEGFQVFFFFFLVFNFILLLKICLPEAAWNRLCGESSSSGGDGGDDDDVSGGGSHSNFGGDGGGFGGGGGCGGC